MVLNMSSADKSSVDTPTYIISSAPPSSNEKQRDVGLRKKLTVFAVVTIIVVGLIVAAVLIGIRLVTDAQKEIVQFQLQFKGSDNQDTNQNVVSDPNDNVVIYHVTKPGQDAYVVNDFNKGIQTVKLQISGGTTCYVTPLNQSAVMDPASITGPESMTGSMSSNGQPFLLSNTPVVDRSFMTKKAADICSGISVYWAYRSCGAQPITGQNATTPYDRSKRSLYTFSPKNGLPCRGGCCGILCACSVSIIEYISGSVHECEFSYRTGTCCSSTNYCNHYYTGTWPTPGLTGPDCHY